jgi:hypothetical protein
MLHFSAEVQELAESAMTAGAREGEIMDVPTPDQSGTQHTRDAWLDAGEPLTTAVRRLWDNAGAGILPVGAFLVVKGFVLSKGDIPVALGILQNAGLSTVVIGGLLSSLPVLAAAMLATTIFREVNRVPRRTPGSGPVRPPRLPFRPISPLTVVMLASVLLCTVLTQWTVMVSAVVIGLVIGGFQRTGKTWLRRIAYLAAAIIGVVAVVAMLYNVWLPHEKLAIAGVKEPVVGYVLADDPDGWITILVSGTHGLVWYRDTAVTARTPCEQAPWDLWSQVTDAATLWQEVTKVPVLNRLHPPTESPCPR